MFRLFGITHEDRELTLDYDTLSSHIEDLNSLIIDEDITFFQLHTIVYNVQKIIHLHSRLNTTKRLSDTVELCEGLQLKKRIVNGKLLYFVHEDKSLLNNVK